MDGLPVKAYACSMEIHFVQEASMVVVAILVC